MGIVQYIAKILVLLILILVMVVGGLFWFDYLGVLNLKQTFAPIYRILGLVPQTRPAPPAGSPDTSDLDDDRFAKRLEALDIRVQELDKRETDVTELADLNEQIAKELEERKTSQEEREKNFDAEVNKYNDRMATIEQNARNLMSMPPRAAVDILLTYEDQLIIDTLRKAAEIGSTMNSYWLSLMPPDRAGTIQRKMTEKPNAPN
jgi:flagellar protein FlbB